MKSKSLSALLLIFTLGLVAFIMAANPAPVSRARTTDLNISPKGFQQITDVTTATSLTVPTKGVLAVIQVETKAVRWRDDGTDPTAAVGIQVSAGSSFWYNGDLTTLKFIQESPGAPGAVLNISYYGFD